MESAPDDVIGGIRIWLRENYRQLKLETRKTDEFGMIVAPGTVRVYYRCPDKYRPYRADEEEQYVDHSVDMRFGVEALVVGNRFAVGYHDPEFFDKLGEVIEHLLEGGELYEFDQWGYAEWVEREPPPAEREHAQRRVATPLVVPLGLIAPRCRGPPTSKAEARQDGEESAALRPAIA